MAQVAQPGHLTGGAMPVETTGVHRSTDRNTQEDSARVARGFVYGVGLSGLFWLIAAAGFWLT